MIDVEQLAKEGILFDGRYKLLRALSTDGGTADVWLAIDVNTIDNPGLTGKESEAITSEDSGMMVAIKIYRPKNALDIEGEQRFRDEYKIVHNCRHTNLLQPTNFSICEDTPYLELPYCKNGSSEMLIGKKMEEKDIWKFIFDVSSGLSYLHASSPQIIHQDIKPANVLIDDYKNYAITDFGISSPYGGKHSYYYDDDNSGTMAYMAPERFCENYSPIAESDVWAFGATLYEILTGEVPYKEEGGRNQLENNFPLKSMGNAVPKSIQRLIVSCLSLDPKKRPTANQIIALAEKHLSASNRGKVFLSLLLTLGLVVLGCYLYFGKPQPISIEDRFKEAVALLDGDSQQEAEQGVAILDSLVNSDYLPAMLELAKTYGWYSDSVSLRRKDMLNITYNTEGLLIYLLVDNERNDRARELFLKILDSKDSTNMDDKADAAFRLATYYANNTYMKQNFPEAKKYLLKAQEYARGGDDTTLQKKIENGIKTIEKKLEKK